MTEGLEKKELDSRKQLEPYGRQQRKEVGETDISHSIDTESEAETECSIALINVPRHAIGKF